MNPAEIATLKALCDAATPGPWRHDSFTVMPSEGVIQARCADGCDGGCDEGGEIEVGRICAQHAHAQETICDVYGLEQFAAADAAFIAAARTALPAAISALEEARRERDAARGEWDVLRTSLYHRAEAAESRADALQAEVEKWKARALGGEAELPGVRSEVERLRARADAAWRAALEAAALVVGRMGCRCADCRLEHTPELRLKVAAAILALPPPSATAAPAEEEKGDDDDGPFCPDPCGGDLYLTASAGSAWLATCGSCGKVWTQQPWVTEPTGRAPSRGEVG